MDRQIQTKNPGNKIYSRRQQALQVTQRRLSDFLQMAITQRPNYVILYTFMYLSYVYYVYVMRLLCAYHTLVMRLSCACHISIMHLLRVYYRCITRALYSQNKNKMCHRISMVRTLKIDNGAVIDVLLAFCQRDNTLLPKWQSLSR